MVENVKLINKVTSDILELDVVETPNYILDTVDWGQIKSTHHSYKYVNQIGVYVTGTSLETRDVSVTGWIVASSENLMTDRKMKLNRFVNPQQAIELRYKDYVLDFLPDTSIKYSAIVKENNEVICKFKITGVAPNPLFRKENENKVSAATTYGMFHFPLMIDAIDNEYPTVMFGLREPSLVLDIYNNGSVATGVTIIFKALGTLTNPSLINVNTQEYIKINKTMTAGEEIRINTNIGEKKIVGIFNSTEQNYFRYRDLDSTWLQLEVGDNVFRYDADSNIDMLECYVYFYDRYLEVQECY